MLVSGNYLFKGYFIGRTARFGKYIFQHFAGGIYIAAMRYKDYLLDQIEYIPKEENPTFINEESSVVHISEYTSETYIPPIEEEHIHNFLLIIVNQKGFLNFQSCMIQAK